MPQSDGDVDKRILWCGNLHPDVTDELLYELFLQAGPLEAVKIVKSKSGPTGTGYAFITFQHEESVPYAQSLMNGIRLFNLSLKLQYRNTGGVSTPTQESPLENASRQQALARSSSFPGRLAEGEAGRMDNGFATPRPPAAGRTWSQLGSLGTPQQQQQAFQDFLQNMQQQITQMPPWQQQQPMSPWQQQQSPWQQQSHSSGGNYRNSSHRNDVDDRRRYDSSRREDDRGYSSDRSDSRDRRHHSSHQSSHQSSHHSSRYGR